MPVFSRTALLLVWLSSFGISTHVRAQDDAPQTAVDAFERARAAYAEGRYEDAVVDLELALQHDPESPVLMFNLARVYELSGDLDRALETARVYMDLLPPEDLEERARTERMITRMQGAQEWLALRTAEPDVSQFRGLEERRVLVSERGVADTAFWATMGAGIGILALGGGLGAWTFAQDQNVADWVLRDEPGNDLTARNEAAQLGDDLALATDITLGVGAATVVAAGLLYLLRSETLVVEEDAAESPESTEEDAEPADGDDGTWPPPAESPAGEDEELDLDQLDNERPPGMQGGLPQLRFAMSPELVYGGVEVSF